MNIDTETAMDDILYAVQQSGVDGISLRELTQRMREQWLRPGHPQTTPAVTSMVRGLTTAALRDRRLATHRVGEHQRFVIVLHSSDPRREIEVDVLLRWTARRTGDDGERQRICIMLAETLSVSIHWLRSEIAKHENRMKALPAADP